MDLRLIGLAGTATLSVAACAFDIRTRRVPNVLTLTGAGLGLAWQLASGGWSGLGVGLLGLLVGLAVFFPLFALRGMGAGDVKFMAALGAWLGPVQILWVALFGSIAGGVLALVVAVGHGYLRTAARNIWSLVGHWRAAGLEPVPEMTLAGAKGPRLAYALPIAVGVVVTLWLR